MEDKGHAGEERRRGGQGEEDAFKEGRQRARLRAEQNAATALGGLAQAGARSRAGGRERGNRQGKEGIMGKMG